MSCPTEFSWSVYVDDELSPPERRSAEMHLVSCRACRSRVMALRDEIRALVHALDERPTAPARIRPQTAPARDLSWGLPAAIAAMTAVLSIGGVLLEMRLPGVLDLLNPKRLLGVNEMLFDAVFMLRDRWPEFFEAATLVGAMAAFSALGCAVLHALSRRITRSSTLSLGLLVLLGLPDVATALDFRRDQDTHIAAGETVSETLVCTGDVVTIEGTIDGDLIVGAERFTMRGTVTGNLFFFGSEVEIDGTTQGSIFGIGDRVDFGGGVDGALTLAGDRLHLTDDARAGRDVTLFGEGVRVGGALARDLTFAGEWIEIRGKIARDLHVLGADRVALLDSARVGGGARAHLWGQTAEIDRAPGSSIGGELDLTKASLVREHYLAHYRHARFYWALLVAAAAAFVFGLLLYWIDPRLFESDAPDTRGFLRSLGIGFIAVLVGPVALLLVGMTVVGIPIAVLGLFLLISSVYTAYVIVAGLIGQLVLTPSTPGLGAFAPSLLAGVLILSAIAALPFVGPAIRILAVLFGLGCLFERVRGMHAMNLGGIRD